VPASEARALEPPPPVPAGALECVFEAAGLPDPSPLPGPLESAHGGPFGLAPDSVVANFVQSLDGVVALPVPASPGVISGGSAADRFVMGLLRASAGAVLIGASTLRAEPEHRWTPERVRPDLAGAWAELRAALGLARKPELFVLTASGELDASAAALREGAVVLTTARGAATLDGRLPEVSEVVVAETDGGVRIADALAAIRARGHGVVLSEGGPHVLGQLLAEGLLDELFLTMSPTLFGRTAGLERPALVQGVDLLGHQPRADLRSVRRHGSHLFLRYGLRGSAP
jgi:riboflavin biosynthesis pyrimidine reductase